MGANRHTAAPGKRVHNRVYLHTTALGLVDSRLREPVERARAACPEGAEQGNVVSVDHEGEAVSFLCYPGFFDEPCPTLAKSWKIDIGTGCAKFRDYSDSLNRPILHRKELLLAADHPDVPRFARLTADLESLGLFDDPMRIGFEVQWQALLTDRGYRVIGHDLVPIGNVEEADLAGSDLQQGHAPIQRHLTALSRQGFSAPVAAMLRVGLLDTHRSLFDYGCGKGDDVAGLLTAGVSAAGWDPYFAPEQPLLVADLVNLGFVINVIEDPVERREALVTAFSLARTALCVAAMLAHEDAVRGRPFGDGGLTSRQTFQKYYSQVGLRSYLKDVLQEFPIPLAPGVFLVFKDKTAEEGYLLKRSRRPPRFGRAVRPPPAIRRPPTRRKVQAGVASPVRERARTAKPPRPDPWDLHPQAGTGLCRQWEALGRQPGPDEIENAAALAEAFGSLAQAFRAARARIDPSRLEAGCQQRAEDVLVHLALQRFGGRRKFRHLDPGLQRDIRAFFGTWAAAERAADTLLAAAGDPSARVAAAQDAARTGLGWLIENRSLQLHGDLIARLPAVLRVFVGCAAVLYGDVGTADMVKLHLASSKVTMLRCCDFTNAVPSLVERVKVDFRTQEVRILSYGTETGFPAPPVYMKSRYMHEEMAGYPEQLVFDAQLAELITVDDRGRGPGPAELEARLSQAGLKVEGWELVPDDRIPALDEACGINLTFRDLIQCGETAARTALPNLPQQPATYQALRDLAVNVLDPVIEWFGSIELTFGFCSPQLARRIPGRIAPGLDQHAGHETKQTGAPVCARLGAAADFLVRDEDMRDVARWIIEKTPFDRLYFYAADRPIHVSYRPKGRGLAYEMVPCHDGRRMPRPFRF